jgi:hypothetical protein
LKPTKDARLPPTQLGMVIQNYCSFPFLQFSDLLFYLLKVGFTFVGFSPYVFAKSFMPPSYLINWLAFVSFEKASF